MTHLLEADGDRFLPFFRESFSLLALDWGREGEGLGLLLAGRRPLPTRSRDGLGLRRRLDTSGLPPFSLLLFTSLASFGLASLTRLTGFAAGSGLELSDLLLLRLFCLSFRLETGGTSFSGLAGFPCLTGGGLGVGEADEEEWEGEGLRLREFLGGGEGEAEDARSELDRLTALGLLFLDGLLSFSGSPLLRALSGSPRFRVLSGSPLFRALSGSPLSRAGSGSPRFRVLSGSPLSRAISGSPRFRVFSGSPRLSALSGSSLLRAPSGSPLLCFTSGFGSLGLGGGEGEDRLR